MNVINATEFHAEKMIQMANIMLQIYYHNKKNKITNKCFDSKLEPISDPIVCNLSGQP